MEKPKNVDESSLGFNIKVKGIENHSWFILFTQMSQNDSFILYKSDGKLWNNN